MAERTIAREIQLLRGCVMALHGEHRVREALAHYKWNREMFLRKVVDTPKAADALEAFIGDPLAEIITLEDVVQHTRDEVAAVRGVGPLTMEKLDAAIADRGLAWSEAV